MEELLGLIEEGLSMANSKDMPLAGIAFATSVATKLGSIQTTIRRTDHVTPRQADAVSNMVAGLQRWLASPTLH